MPYQPTPANLLHSLALLPLPVLAQLVAPTVLVQQRRVLPALQPPRLPVLLPAALLPQGGPP